MPVTTDREFYVLLWRLVAEREARVGQYEGDEYPFRICRRATPANSLGIPFISFRHGNRELRQPSLKDIRRMGIAYAPGMLRAISAIARLDRAILKLVTITKKATIRATHICLEILQACEMYDIRPGLIFASPIEDFRIEGPYSPLPFVARKLAMIAIENALAEASRQMTACNRIRRKNRKEQEYSPRAAPNILIRFNRGVTPARAEWGFYVRPKEDGGYYFTRQLKSRRNRMPTTMESAPTLLHLRRFRLKPFGMQFQSMGEFVTLLMKLRRRHRSLWELIRTAPVSSRDLALLPTLAPLRSAVQKSRNGKKNVDELRNYE